MAVEAAAPSTVPTSHFVDAVASFIDHADQEEVARLQGLALGDLNSAALTLRLHNERSEALFRKLVRDWVYVADVMRDMRKDMDVVQSKLRLIRSRLEAANGPPPASAMASVPLVPGDYDDGDEVPAGLNAAM